MPWPMIHFSIAYRYASGHALPAFLLGSIAPDAVLVREDDKDGKLRSHLGRNPTTEDFVQFIKTYTEEGTISEEYKQFLFGYIAHVFADLKWGEFKNQVSHRDRSLRDQLWQEENQMDFDLYRSVAWREQIKVHMMNSPLYELHGIYTAVELDTWRKGIFQWLEQPDNESNMVNTYITSERVEGFILKTADGLNELNRDLTMRLGGSRTW